MITSYPKDKLNILLLENVNPEAVAVFRQHGYSNVMEVTGALSETELISRISLAIYISWESGLRPR